MQQAGRGWQQLINSRVPENAEVPSIMRRLKYPVEVNRSKLQDC